jgi:hypothetical protein
MVRAISDNGNESTERSGNSFTASSATDMLPLVRRIVDDLLRLDRAIKAQREQLKGVDQLTGTIEQSDYQDELSDIRGSLDDDQRRFETCLGELTSLGINPHLPFDGSVDFPTELNRRAVRLCWQPGEERVEYWHEVGASKDRRRKLRSESQELDSLSQEDL